jgi:hypothetical protein
VLASPPVSPPPPRPQPVSEAKPMAESAQAKLDQIKDLYLTAEAIGESNLEKHFEQVSQRQRELIQEFFESADPHDGVGG